MQELELLSDTCRLLPSYGMVLEADRAEESREERRKTGSVREVTVPLMLAVCALYGRGLFGKAHTSRAQIPQAGDS